MTTEVPLTECDRAIAAGAARRPRDSASGSWCDRTALSCDRVSVRLQVSIGSAQVAETPMIDHKVTRLD